MASTELRFPQEDSPSRVTKVRVNKGTTVTAGRILLHYRVEAKPDAPEKKLKAQQFGKVTQILVKENELVHPGQVVLVLEGCKHPTVIKDLCADCGSDLREELAAGPEKSSVHQANVPMVHSVPELKVTAELAEKIGKEDKERLLQHKQLVLLVDLDQTIVHTTNDNVPAELEDVYHFQLYGANSPWYHTRLRPHTRKFLSEISQLYELHICTFGARQYAHTVASILDGDGKLFSHRILSRDECFDPQSKTANLKALFPCGVDMVCIIDDRDDVWQGCANLVQVKPYHYFLHTGDINVPPGLGKQDDPSPPRSLTEEALGETNSNDNTENGENKNVDKDITEAKNDSKDKKPDKKSVKKSSTTEKKETTDSSDKKEKVEDVNDPEDNKSKQLPEEKANSSGQQKIDKKEKPSQQEEVPKEVGPEEDQDDYLLYLEDILKRIHTEFYANSDKESVRTKTLREIIPKVRSHVLQGLCLTFSGLIPNNQKLEQSRVFKVARAFGAQITQELSEQTTHLVAIQPGTVKVRDAKKQGKVKIVNPDWLWTCAERWEHVDERLYPLREVPLHKAREFRKPPAHCSTPEPEEIFPEVKETFASSINPLAAFSSEDVAKMAKEVDDDLSDLDLDEDSDNENTRKREYDSDSNDVYGYNDPDDPPLLKKSRIGSDDESNAESASDIELNSQNCCFADDDDEDPITRFRRGESLPDDFDFGENSQDSGSVGELENDDLSDDREYNAMGAALEREFLSD